MSTLMRALTLLMATALGCAAAPTPETGEAVEPAAPLRETPDADSAPAPEAPPAVADASAASSHDTGVSGSADGAVEPSAAPAPLPFGDFDNPLVIPPRLARYSVRDGALRRVKAAVLRPLATVQQAAPGIRPAPELDGRPLGRSHRRLETRLGEGSIIERLDRLVLAHARPSPEDFVFYRRIGQLPATTAAELAAGFDISSELPPAEAAALEALIAAIQAQLSREPTLRAYALQAGWADAVGALYHGVALVNEAADEVLWIFTEEVWCEC